VSAGSVRGQYAGCRLGRQSGHHTVGLRLNDI
jgi:hypothetical protein